MVNKQNTIYQALHTTKDKLHTYEKNIRVPV